MNDRPIVERTEIMEERGNRDAFHLCMVLAALFALLLVVLGILAWNIRVYIPAGHTLRSVNLETSAARLALDGRRSTH